MKDLYKLYHEHSLTHFKRLYEQRLEGETTAFTGLNIKPRNQPDTFELFYVPTNKIINLVSEIHKYDRHLNHLYYRLPDSTKDSFIFDCVIEELFNTNDLEGVKSSKQEIAQSAKNIQSNNNKKNRFYSMIVSYVRLTNGYISLPEKAQDIRKIYDDIVKGEIDNEEMPDGKVFRKEPTYVLKSSGSEKVIHTGTFPEINLINELDSLLDFLNENKEIPDLVKVAIGHYYFGYIHPFYDGNGRTSRFISSMYLTKSLSSISCLSLSRGSNANSKKYYKAFEIANSFRSRGEVNNFIVSFLEMLRTTLKEMTGELKEKRELIILAKGKLNEKAKSGFISPGQKKIMEALTENYFFETDSGMTIKEISKNAGLSSTTVRKDVRELLGKELITKVGSKPAYYNADKRFFEN